MLSQAHALPYHGIENEMFIGAAPICPRVFERRPMHDAVVIAIRVSGFREARPVARHDRVERRISSIKRMVYRERRRRVVVAEQNVALHTVDDVVRRKAVDHVVV